MVWRFYVAESLLQFSVLKSECQNWCRGEEDVKKFDKARFDAFD